MAHCERVVAGPVGAHDVWIKDEVGRGRTVEVDGERFLPDAVTQELAGFVLRTILLVVPLCIAAGVLIGHYVWR